MVHPVSEGCLRFGLFNEYLHHNSSYMFCLAEIGEAILKGFVSFRVLLFCLCLSKLHTCITSLCCTWFDRITLDISTKELSFPSLHLSHRWLHQVMLMRSLENIGWVCVRGLAQNNIFGWSRVASFALRKSCPLGNGGEPPAQVEGSCSRIFRVCETYWSI